MELVQINFLNSLSSEFAARERNNGLVNLVKINAKTIRQVKMPAWS